MAEPAVETKDTVKKLSFGGVGKSLLGGAKKSVIKTVDFLHKKFGSTKHIDEGKKLSNTECLGEIYKMMKIMDEDKKLRREIAINNSEQEQHEKDQRNKEIISALTGKKFKKTKFKPKRKIKTKKKVKATKISESAGFSLGDLGTITLGTAAVIGTGALMTAPTSAFANTMKMEQGAKSREEALKKAHKSVKDRDNSLSYGVISLSSIRTEGKDNSSLDSFIKDNPQFKLPDPGQGGKNPNFIEQWNKIPSEELLDAQEKWYQTHVFNPATRLLESSGVDPKISSDERVRAFMADRGNQVGTAGSEKAIKKSKANEAKTPEEFIDKMTEYDVANVEEQFPKYLAQYPDRKDALIRRMINRKNLSLKIESKGATSSNITIKPPALPTHHTPEQDAKQDKTIVVQENKNTSTDDELEKQRLKYEKDFENFVDMGLDTKQPPVVSKPQLWKSMTSLYENDNILYTEQEKLYVERQKQKLAEVYGFKSWAEYERVSEERIAKRHEILDAQQREYEENQRKIQEKLLESVNNTTNISTIVQESTEIKKETGNEVPLLILKMEEITNKLKVPLEEGIYSPYIYNE